jgi:hypothetical protein
MPQPTFGRLLAAFLALAAYRTIFPPTADGEASGPRSVEAGLAERREARSS